MDGRLNDLSAIPDATAKDIETLLAVLARGARRIERVEMSFGTVWVKRYGAERPVFWSRAQNALALLFRKPFLRPSPQLDRKAMVDREVRRIAAFAAAGLPVPKVLYRSGSALVLSDAGPTIGAQLGVLKSADPADHDDLLVACAADLGALHAKRLCHGRPHPRDLFLEGGRVGYMDFEEEPEAVMPLPTAQARDLWLLFLQLVPSALEGETTAGRALSAWMESAPGDALAELCLLVAFLAKFLWLTRLIGRVHMGSDLRRFLAATRYLSQVLLPPRAADASKAGKDD
ncbi:MULTISPECIES: serine/threonine protein phosphatase [unclassified Shinella]|uniref:serine/threonine protein phosphatase n=1 Tax=unclassified Shinella TaxID=2643062 RepID=UPI00225D7F99|nr:MULTISPECIES: serine/threonine protein phosphatase [unclassified Shinella]MCO5137320.1 serine/threonine protein phosphatase [Shinella sp.]MDC7257504.1 serine/threonine protein phosphatase [Shinella sp. YE25]CAI0340407.1 Mn2+-dependent serine/threonine protein kinase [Rhizobiaceae bacterium]CAK7258772.1 Mn2+-dependent serine/threonine protein kinase [Shinella sp. WSC3-e]